MKTMKMAIYIMLPIPVRVASCGSEDSINPIPELESSFDFTWGGGSLEDDYSVYEIQFVRAVRFYSIEFYTTERADGLPCFAP